MRDLLARALFVVSTMLPYYLISASYARSDDWGCQVILCISNPGGPTQYAACEPPIQRLWSELAAGHSFPTCSGVGFQTSEPGYEPYYCDAGYRLVGSFGARGETASCVSTSPQKVDGSICTYSHDNFTSIGGECMRYVTTQAHLRAQPHYVDVTIEGVGKQRVWY